VQIGRGLIFYAGLFWQASKLPWPEVQELARDFDGIIATRWPRYYEEIRG